MTEIQEKKQLTKGEYIVRVVAFASAICLIFVLLYGNIAAINKYNNLADDYKELVTDTKKYCVCDTEFLQQYGLVTDFGVQPFGSGYTPNN